MIDRNLFKYFRLFFLVLLTSFKAKCGTFPGNDQSETKQLENFASNIQESIENNNPNYINKSFDVDDFLLKIMKENADPDDTSFNKGFEEGFKNNFDLGEMIVDGIKHNGRYTFLKTYKRDNNDYILFRVFSNNGINYHEFEVKQIQDKYKITDVFLFLSGEKLSETIARVYNSFRLLNSHFGKDSLSYLQSISELGNIKSIASKGKYSKAFRKWQKLPPQLKSDKMFLITGIQIACYLDNETYLKNFNQFVTRFPENSGKYLIPLDGLVMHKNYSMAMACIDSLDKRLNYDPMLNYLRGNMLYEMGHHTEAATMMCKLIDSIPDFEIGYYSLLGLYVKDKNYTEATQILDKIVLTFNYYKDDLANILKDYPEFINSKEYQAWLNQ